MKKIIFFPIVLLSMFNNNAQPLIDNYDMPTPGDIVTYNYTNNLGTYNYAITGNNYTWDFSYLISAGQTTDTFVSVNSTPINYWLSFSNATVALKEGNLSQGGMALNDIYSFYKNSSSEYSLLGYGGKLNAIAIPVKYDNPDVLYKFPINVGNIDSSICFLNINIPGLGYYAQHKKRINIVDGWGTLILPLVTLQTIRIKSDVYTYDTIYDNSTGTGFGVNSFQTEYKWLAKGHKLPVLEIVKSASNTLATFFGGYNYIIENNCLNCQFLIYPNPVIDKIYLKTNQNLYSDALIIIYSLTGLKLYEEKVSFNSNYEHEIVIDRTQFKSGIYLMAIYNNDTIFYNKFVLY
ncbi:MAG TPA: T9SS type A sorting domain-containing protein [Bacteroidales bacterium]|nr:T9SS type A sorting domain-containing protein [Bacteroidales bacterium]